MTSSASSRIIHPLIIAAAFCVVLFLIGILTRPVFPVDETRYLTVAWEMFSKHDYILPHLNNQPYDHKPPLLFWSINAMWHLFGISQQAAMAVPYFYAFLLACVTWRLARHMKPADPEFAALTTYLLIGSLPFVIYSNLIMFDLMLGVFAILGITSVWDFAKTGEKKHILLLALALGLGAITKGPVILLHVLVPAALLRFWLPVGARGVSNRTFTLGIIAAVIGGFAIGLSWAIPAAIKGGPEFADKIFWGQTAGRVANAFDHKRPFYWYFLVLPLMLAPWVFSPLFWRGVKTIKKIDDKIILRFLGIWLLPVFVAFCLISGKQAHYLIPLVPGFALFVAILIKRYDNVRLKDAAFPFAISGVFLLVPIIAKLIIQNWPTAFKKNVNFTDMAQQVDMIVPFCLLVSAVTIFAVMGRKKLLTQVLSLSIASLIVITSFFVEASHGYFRNYDLRPIAAIIQKNPEAPLAFLRNYHGEWGFLARTNRTVTQMEPKDLDAWFNKNPNGIAMVRTRDESEFSKYDILFTMPYRAGHVYAVVVPRGAASRFDR